MNNLHPTPEIVFHVVVAVQDDAQLHENDFSNVNPLVLVL